jgi:hypothetical protein
VVRISKINAIKIPVTILTFNQLRIGVEATARMLCVLNTISQATGDGQCNCGLIKQCYL